MGCIYINRLKSILLDNFRIRLPIGHENTKKWTTQTHTDCRCPKLLGHKYWKLSKKLTLQKQFCYKLQKNSRHLFSFFLLSFVFMLYNNNNNNNCNNNNNINIFLQKCLVNIRIYVTNLYNHCILLEIWHDSWSSSSVLIIITILIII